MRVIAFVLLLLSSPAAAQEFFTDAASEPDQGRQVALELTQASADERQFIGAILRDCSINDATMYRRAEATNALAQRCGDAVTGWQVEYGRPLPGRALDQEFNALLVELDRIQAFAIAYAQARTIMDEQFTATLQSGADPATAMRDHLEMQAGLENDMSEPQRHAQVFLAGLLALYQETRP